jgi:cyclic pyranopterin phosphate synthase
MPADVFGPGYKFLPRKDLLSFEELTRLAQIFNKVGIRKIRLTGGEPLLRHDLEVLVMMLAEIPDLEIALTTNGSLLSQKAHLLKNAGLDRITVSLDSLDDDVFRQMNGIKFPVSRILEGIKAAEDAGFGSIKINVVVKRGINDHTIISIAKHFFDSPHIVRYIEYTDVGNTNCWNINEVVPAEEIIDKIKSVYPIEPVDPNYRGEVAKRWRYVNGNGEIGVIASVTQPFCADCTRVRISARGQLFTCLFAGHGYDLRQSLRDDSSDDQIRQIIESIWHKRNDRYSEIRADAALETQKVEMSYIGG